MKKPTNCLELCDYIANVLSDCDDPRKVAAAAVKTAAAGKIISAVALQLQYAHMRREIPDHPWLKGGELVPALPKPGRNLDHPKS